MVTPCLMWSTYNNTTLLPGGDCLLLATQMLLCVTETFSDSFYHLGQVNRDDVKICFPTLHILLAANVFFSLIPWFRGTVPDYLHCCLWWLQVCMVAMEASLGWPNDSRQTAKKCNEISWIQSSLLRPSSCRAPRPCVMSSSSQCSGDPHRAETWQILVQMRPQESL